MNNRKTLQLNINKLNPDHERLTVHSRNKVLYLANCIDVFGFNSPIMLDSENRIVAGNARYLAALELELKTVPCIVLHDLPKAFIVEYAAADNRLGQNIEITQDELQGFVYSY